MRQADLTFVIFTLMVVGVVYVGMEDTLTTSISKYGLALYHGIQDGTVVGVWKLPSFMELTILW